MEMGMSEKQRAFLTDRLRAKWGEKKKSSFCRASFTDYLRSRNQVKKKIKIKKFGLVNVEEM